MERQETCLCVLVLIAGGLLMLGFPNAWAQKQAECSTLQLSGVKGKTPTASAWTCQAKIREKPAVLSSHNTHSHTMENMLPIKAGQIRKGIRKGGKKQEGWEMKPNQKQEAALKCIQIAVGHIKQQLCKGRACSQGSQFWRALTGCTSEIFSNIWPLSWTAGALVVSVDVTDVSRVLD